MHCHIFSVISYFYCQQFASIKRYANGFISLFQSSFCHRNNNHMFILPAFALAKKGDPYCPCRPSTVNYGSVRIIYQRRLPFIPLTGVMLAHTTTSGEKASTFRTKCQYQYCLCSDFLTSAGQLSTTLHMPSLALSRVGFLFVFFCR